MSVLLQATGLHVSYHGREVLTAVDVHLQAGALVGVLGANGAGKSTLLRVLAGLEPPMAGTVEYAGQPLAQLADSARHIAYLEPQAQCHWPMTVEQAVALGRLPHLGLWQRMDRQDKAAIEQAMEQADILHLRGRAANALSTGEQARVALARALAGQPQVLLADEPVAGLDPAHQLSVMERLAAKAAEGMAVVTALHDLTLAMRYCRQVWLLHEGRLVAAGPPADALTAENLALALQISALSGSHEGESYLLPWRGQ